MKRRPCTGSQNRSPTNSPRGAIHSAASGKISSRSKSFQELKKRRVQRRVTGSKKSRRSQELDDSQKSTDVKKDAFGSLESLFDVKRPLKLPQIPRYSDPIEPDNYSTSESESDVKNPKPLIVNLYDKSARVHQEPDILVETWKSYKLIDDKGIEKLEELESEIIEANFQKDWNLEESSAFESMSYEDMADNVYEEPLQILNNSNVTPSAPFEEPTASDEQSPKGTGNKKSSAGDTAKNESSPHPVSPGAGEGVPMHQGDHRDSILSSTPLTDSEVIKEMIEADERCKVVAEEIKDTKKQILELRHKKTLSEEDTKQLQEKQASLLTKMEEFEKITRKIQRTLGVSDPSSRTFAKMFDMLPYPHKRAGVLEEEEEQQELNKHKGSEKNKNEEDELFFDDNRFDLPEPEYPEDRLPRAIICGVTEDKIPKIVIPDSRPKGTRCLKNLTGKLSESLNMQEKLVQENAKLEGGRYKLEEALLEKDNNLDSLQRKVCSLQAEMRIVVRENTELNRQLANYNGPRSTGFPFCCFQSPRDNSPRSTNLQPSSYSYVSSSRRDDESCRCRHCLQEQSDGESRQANTICVNPEVLNRYSKSCVDSPRLSGGGTREDNNFSDSTNVPVMSCRGPGNVKVSSAPGVRACPAEMESQSANYGTCTKQLAQQLDSMESEVRNMQMELANVHRERQQLEQQRKLLKCTGPCAPCSCCPPGSSPGSHQPVMVPCVAGGSAPSNQQPISGIQRPKITQQQETPSCSGICVNAPMGASTCPQQQLRDLREQYARLQEDYRNKLVEVSCMRTEADKLKQEAREAKEEREKVENRLADVQGRMKTMQSDKSRFHGSKEQMMEQEQALLVAKQRYREAQDELEELRSLIQDQANQLEDYRNKYLQAQEQVEEQRRQLDLMEMDNARMNENVNLEMGRVKNQFKEKLAELAPLPDILKQTQAKLQEVQQMRLIAERNCEDLSRELLTCKDKLGTLTSQLNAMKSENTSLHDERGMGTGRCDELEKKISELKNENERMKDSITRFEDSESQMEQRLEEKMHEIVQLTAMLEEVREDSARQVARTKERCETVRRTMQGQIAEMEKQLAQCRATARAAQKDRDEIRQKMQGQINNLMEAFEQAQGRIRSLQGHVNYLKTSYTNIFNPGGQGEPPIGYMPSETGGQGYDSCDCNY